MPRRAPTHKPPRPRLSDGRPSASARGYDERWKRLRAYFLAKHPLCAACERQGVLTPALHVDHKVSLEAGGTHEESNLQALCHSCHSAKTCRADGGFGRAREGA